MRNIIDLDGTISIHALREEGDVRPECQPQRQTISIHALREEGDRRRTGGNRSDQISIHALREEGDSAFLLRKCLFTNFYPRPPRGGRRSSAAACTTRPNFYPRPPRGGRRKGHRSGGRFCRISIHALREEGDFLRWTPSGVPQEISIHALREEGDE